MKIIIKNLKSGWMTFAHKFARVQTTIIITIFYFLVISPFGLLMTIFGWDPLKKRGFHQSIKKQNKSTNWQELKNQKNDISDMKRLS